MKGSQPHGSSMIGVHVRAKISAEKETCKQLWTNNAFFAAEGKKHTCSRGSPNPTTPRFANISQHFPKYVYYIYIYTQNIPKYIPFQSVIAQHVQNIQKTSHSEFSVIFCPKIQSVSVNHPTLSHSESSTVKVLNETLKKHPPVLPLKRVGF